MGKLKPVGSEKLEGVEKINRILEIANYKLNVPKSINEDKSLEYSKTLADGNSYYIVKEKTGYVIKKGLNESTSDYLEPIKNRKFYPSYSQALKRLNLITKEVNQNEGYYGNISLFNESENVEEKKYFLKYGETTEQEETPIQTAPAPTKAPTPVGPTQAAVPAAPEPEVPMEEPMGGEMEGEEDMDVEETPEPEMEDKGEEEVTFKTIQKLTGKLAQKIRSIASDEENEMTSQDVKYVINSILSALDLDLLDPEDAEEIMGKFEGQEGEEMGMEDEGEMMPEPPMESGMGGGEEEIMPEPPMEPEGEMKEMYPRHNRRESFEEREHKMRVKEMGYGVSESKVDRILQKYFNEKPKNSINEKIETLAENYNQEMSSKKFVSNFPKAKLLGKTKKGFLVFEVNNEKFGVSPKGRIL